MDKDFGVSLLKIVSKAVHNFIDCIFQIERRKSMLESQRPNSEDVVLFRQNEGKLSTKAHKVDK